MAQPWAEKFYQSTIWKKQRLYVLKRDHFTCTEPGCHARASEVHHIIELTETNIDNVNISLNEKNLRSLCHDCHTRITSEMKANVYNILPQITFDSNGFPIESTKA